ncbi:uncharacterized protein LOC129578824 [Sitodiplosis mosellana]|uniref:uncharacterized protein LOC129578824 n=1 Tax=Sitodiplosis mosellana TaxID=263140 RepID=UPI002444F7F8|nr:uncharacterized protein LOC129578824 [Sitodiplosis mosellana]XP_055323973.1 uncharacterized protein LOC129578824 [Sitodiplosis mosellana]XP_055323974.1 uncharacterized protein LOC129578824 [Sitodiplosis mosellana]
MVRKFFCFDLYTTGLLIGWLGLAESITSCIFSILMLENVDTIITTKDFPDVDIVALRKSVVTILGTYIAFNVIDLLASGLLIAGTVKRNRLLIIPWLINSFISLLFNAIAIGFTFYHLWETNATNYTAIIPFAVAGGIIFAIYVYAYLAIYGLYEDIRRIAPNSEYSSLINNQNNGTVYPIYTRA